MVSASKIFLFCFTLLMIIASVDPNSSAIPLFDADSNTTTTNNTKSSRFLNNDKVTVAVASGCFSAETLVTLISQQQIPISQLRSGDQLFSVDGSTLIHTEMMMMLDKNQLSPTMFYTIMTASGHRVSLTGLHLMVIITKNGEIKHKSAKDIRSGDILRVVIDGQVASSVVTNVTMEMKTGYYAPLTMAGTLLVNDVVAGCFANVENHKMVQFYLSPLRWYYLLSRSLFIEKPFGDQIGDGIHCIPKILYGIVQSFYPSFLRLS